MTVFRIQWLSHCISDIKKPDSRSGRLKMRVLGSGKFYRIGQAGLGTLQFGEGFAYDLLSEASTFAALGRYAEGVADIFEAAAAFIDSVAYLPIGDTLAEAYIHKLGPSLFRTR